MVRRNLDETLDFHAPSIPMWLMCEVGFLRSDHVILRGIRCYLNHACHALHRACSIHVDEKNATPLDTPLDIG